MMMNDSLRGAFSGVCSLVMTLLSYELQKLA